MLAADTASRERSKNNDPIAETLGMGVDAKISLYYFH